MARGTGFIQLMEKHSWILVLLVASLKRRNFIDLLPFF